MREVGNGRKSIHGEYDQTNNKKITVKFPFLLLML